MNDLSSKHSLSSLSIKNLSRPYEIRFLIHIPMKRVVFCAIETKMPKMLWHLSLLEVFGRIVFPVLTATCELESIY